MSGRSVNVARPLGYLCVAGVLALGALVLPGGGAAPAESAPGTGTSVASAPQAPPQDPGCTGVRDSLRPDGPLPAPGAMPPGSTMAAIAERGRLIAGVDQGKYLAGYRDPQTGQLVGADIDIVHSIAKAILGDPGAVQFVVLDIADRAKAVQSGRVDLVVDTFTVSCVRQRSVEFSSAYMTASQRLLVPVGDGVREVEDLAGQRVCTSLGSTTEGVLRGLPLRLDVVSLRGIPDCVVELSGARWRRYPATTSSWRGWRRRTRRRRSSVGHWTTRRTASGCASTSPTSCGSSTACSNGGAKTAAWWRATSGGSAARWTPSRSRRPRATATDPAHSR